MAELSTWLVFGAVAAYVIAMASFAVDLSGRSASARGRRRAAAIGLSTATAGLVLHAAALVMRAVEAGRVPWANMYEFTLTFTFVAVALFLGIQRVRDVRYLGVFVTFLAVAALMLAMLTLYVAPDGVQPALDSYWLVIHVSVAAASTGLFSVSAVASVLQLVRHRYPARVAAAAPALATAGAGSSTLDVLPEEDTGTSDGTAADLDGARAGAGTTTGRPLPGGPLGRLLSQLPEEGTLERFAYRINAVAFVGWTFTLVAGAIWAEHAWGRPWGWDPKETWSLVIFLIYAAYLHVRATVGWASHKFAYFALVGFIALLANFYIVNIFFSGKHSYAGV
jgi:cytochrome c-type biogenesis protein CcsB